MDRHRQNKTKVSVLHQQNGHAFKIGIWWYKFLRQSGPFFKGETRCFWKSSKHLLPHMQHPPLLLCDVCEMHPNEQYFKYKLTIQISHNKYVTTCIRRRHCKVNLQIQRKTDENMCSGSGELYLSHIYHTPLANVK